MVIPVGNAYPKYNLCVLNIFCFSAQCINFSGKKTGNDYSENMGLFRACFFKVLNL